MGNDNSDSLSESCLVRNKKILDWISVNQPQAVIVSNYIYQTSNQADLKRSLIAVRNLSPKVGIVENNPVFPDDRDFMVAKPLVMNPYNAPKSFRIDEMNFRDHHASAKLMTWAHDSGIQVLRTWPLFCDDGFCSRFAGNKWLYTDDNHLSITGANRIIPQFQDFLISKSSR